MKHFLSIHDERNLGPLFRGEARKVLDFRLVERGHLCRSVQTDDVLDAIYLADGLPCTGQEPAALVGIKFPCVGDETIEKMLGDDEIGHVKLNS
jgi:hypothetical protein